jgi:hypothetical protein
MYVAKNRFNNTKYLFIISLVVLFFLLLFCNITAYAADYSIDSTTTYDLSAHSHVRGDLITVNTTDSVELIGTAPDGVFIECVEGVTLTLNGVIIDIDNGIDGNSGTVKSAISFLGSSNTLTISSSNTLVGGSERSGINVPASASLTIQGAGSLVVSGGTGNTSANSGAGIGGNANQSCGVVNISSSTLTVTGGNNAAAIGGGFGGDAGTINITGGYIYATRGSTDSQDIGKGSTGGSSGTLNISGLTTAVFLHNDSALAPTNITNTHEPGGRISLKNTNLTGGLDNGVITLYELTGVNASWENAAGGYFADEVVATHLGYYSDKIKINFDEKLSTSYYDTPTPSCFTIIKDLVTINVLSVYVSSDSVLLNLDTSLSDTIDLSITYTPPLLGTDNQIRNESSVASKSFIKYTDDFSFSLIENTPRDDSIDVLNDTSFVLSLEFSSSVTKNTGNVSLYKSSDDSMILTKDITDADVTVSVNVMTIPMTLASALLLGEDYYVIADSTIITTAWPGINDSDSLNFKTSYDETHNFNGKSGVDVVNAYEIDTIYELFMMRYGNFNRYYKLTKDLDFTNTAHYGCDTSSLIDYSKTPIDWNADAIYTTGIFLDLTTGVGFKPIEGYSGVFDGQGYAISGLRISKDTQNNVGFFGNCPNGSISKTGFLDGVVVGNENVGVILGAGAMTISDCYVDNFTLEAKGNDCGGLIGEYSGNLTDSYISTSLTKGISNIGGICGNLLSGGNISSSISFVSRIEATSANRVVGTTQGTLLDVYAYAHIENLSDSLFPTGSNTSVNGADMDKINSQTVLASIGFDFVSNWEISVGEERPTLKNGGSDDGLIDWWEQTDIKGFSGCLDTVFIDFNNTLLIGEENTPVTTDFTLLNGVSAITVNGVSVSQSRVILTLATNIPFDSNDLSVEYNANHSNTKRLTTVITNINDFVLVNGFKITDVSPNDGRTDVVVSENLDFTLSSEPTLRDVNLTLNNLTDTSSIDISLTDFSQVSTFSNTVTINPTVNLLGEKDYYITLGQGTVENASGVILPLLSSTTAWSFTTLSSNANLSDLRVGVVSEGLSSIEGFSQSTTAYSKEFSNGTSWIYLQPVLSDSKATISVSGSGGLSIDDPSITLVSGVYKINNLVTGTNVVTIEVTAEDATTIKEYDLTVIVDGDLSLSLGAMALATPGATSINPSEDYILKFSHEVTVSENSSSTAPWTLSVTPNSSMENVTNTITDPEYVGEYLHVILSAEDVLNNIDVPIINLPPSSTDHSLLSSYAISTLPNSYMLFSESYLVNNTLGTYSDTGNYIFDIDHVLIIPYWLPQNTQITSSNSSSRFYDMTIGGRDKIQFFNGNYTYNYTYNLARNATN